MFGHTVSPNTTEARRRATMALRHVFEDDDENDSGVCRLPLAAWLSSPAQ